MLEKMQLKLRQIYKAMGQACTPGLDSVTPEFSRTPERIGFKVDFSGGQTEVDLANIVSLLLTDIACIKDHLKAWCQKYGKPFVGDALIDGNKDVGIIHDLWNRDKHFELTRSRSGLGPKLTQLMRGAAISTLPGKRGGIVLNLAKGKFELRGGATARIEIDAMVVDDQDRPIGRFLSIAERAIGAWEKELANAGVDLSSARHPLP